MEYTEEQLLKISKKIYEDVINLINNHKILTTKKLNDNQKIFIGSNAAFNIALNFFKSLEPLQAIAIITHMSEQISKDLINKEVH